jgi:uncharacterized phiE125 gp8 family phage protein
MVHEMRIRPYSVTVAPAIEPVTLDEAKEHLGVLVSDDDDLITALIIAAREFVENYTGRKLIEQTIQYTLPDFPLEGVIYIPSSPVISVDSVEYVDSGGDDQTLSADLYEVRAIELPPEISLLGGESWPSTDTDTSVAVTVTATVGYGDSADDVPHTIKSAIKLMLTKLYDMESSEGRYLDDSIRALLMQHKAWWA